MFAYELKYNIQIIYKLLYIYQNMMFYVITHTFISIEQNNEINHIYIMYIYTNKIINKAKMKLYLSKYKNSKKYKFIM